MPVEHVFPFFFYTTGINYLNMKNPIVVLLITSVVTVMVLLYNPKDKTEQIPLQIYTTEDILLLDKVKGLD